MTTSPEPGWYHAEGDPPGTQRYWTGADWQGGPQPVAGGPSSDVRRDAWDDPQGLQGSARRYGGAWPRFFARVIDGIILAVPVVLLGVVFAIGGDFDPASIAGAGSTLAVTLLSLVIGAVYEIGFVSSSGATPGKMAMGMKIVTESGDSPDVAVAAKRWALALLSVIPILGGLIGFGVAVASGVMISSDDSNRSVYDHVAKTYVVKK